MPMSPSFQMFLQCTPARHRKPLPQYPPWTAGSCAYPHRCPSVVLRKCRAYHFDFIRSHKRRRQFPTARHCRDRRYAQQKRTYNSAFFFYFIHDSFHDCRSPFPYIPCTFRTAQNCCTPGQIRDVPQDVPGYLS